MKFSCEQTLLMSAIATASRTVATKSAIPALEGIHVSAGSYLLLTGYDLETGITVKVEAEVQEEGQCVLPARLLFEIVRKMPDDVVTVSVDSNLKVSIRCGISSFTINAESAEDYPELPEVEYSNAVSISQSIMRDMISGTIFSVSDNMARPIHTGCLIEVEDTSITMVAVDGYRLAKRTYHLEEPTGREMKFVVPSSALRKVEKILSDTDEPMKFSLGMKHILFEIGDATLICRILEGDFLDWRRVVPQNNPIILTASVEELMGCIERVSLIVSEKLKSPVHCTFSENTADFKTASTIGTAHNVCSVAGDGKDLEIGFNCRYLLEALKAIDDQQVVLELASSLTPVVMKPADEKLDFTYMVLPVRLKAGNQE